MRRSRCREIRCCRTQKNTSSLTRSQSEIGRANSAKARWIHTSRPKTQSYRHVIGHALVDLGPLLKSKQKQKSAERSFSLEHSLPPFDDFHFYISSQLNSTMLPGKPTMLLIHMYTEVNCNKFI